ncbi:metallophosphoesterase family protein [Devosia sp. SD17-2]|uniref:metallophosphoesterase family protein n=1 Tax=Devosia sp. SD17-2 TaxID=2976459 RepID=UPI0023D854FE|nr:metallophosphoesterase family protein [Devosia sp. SD17-2]WEJ34435.1 metallophosphatase family protein [Devosia sp. SD17-2]
MRLAVLSDIHGNSSALEAVLEDVARVGVDGIVVLGDHVSGPVDPAGVAATLMGLDAVFIRGNHDRWTVDLGLPGSGAVDRFARGRLSAEQLDWLAALPATAQWGDEVFLCHGTPTDDETPWLDSFFKGRTATLPDEASVAALVEGLDFPVYVCGHTHMPRSVRLADGRLVFNPGAVGMQLVRGSPDARYGLLEKHSRGWQSRVNILPYDHEGAAVMAAENGFPQWRASLVSGWAGPESLR